MGMSVSDKLKAKMIMNFCKLNWFGVTNIVAFNGIKVKTINIYNLPNITVGVVYFLMDFFLVKGKTVFLEGIHTQQREP